MPPGFCSFVVITVLTIQQFLLFLMHNTVKGRYQVKFRIDTKLLLVLNDFSKTQRYNLKTLAQLFQIAIHFHPSHPRRLKHLLIVWIHLYSYLQPNWTIILEVLLMRIRFLAYQGVAKIADIVLFKFNAFQ